MGTRTVRLDDETERTLARLRKLTGLSISEVMKRGIHDYARRAAERPASPHEIYKTLDLGEGGWALAPARDAKQAVKEIIRRKHRR